MKVFVTGADGFIGRNLRQRLGELPDVDVVPFSSSSDQTSLAEALRDVEFVVHLAGSNRPSDPGEFARINAAFTEVLCRQTVHESQRSGRRIPILFASSAQADGGDSLYARSKRDGERAVFGAGKGTPAHVFRLPNVFGKWSRPNYNSVVATFCYNVARNIPLDIHDPAATLTLVYIDDVVARFVDLIMGGAADVDADGFEVVGPQYQITVGQLADSIRRFRESRVTLTVDKVGVGLQRALHATYLSFLPPVDFAYPLTEHADARGKFVEVLKTPESGQFSYFTAGPGITRGGHYHHTKTEKFLVIKGHARFRFRHVQDGTTHELETSDQRPEIVETVPGWAHDITNIGDDELLVMLWANEIFDRVHPDTIVHAT